MSLKSSLQYKYRPTVKYELELHGGDENSIGELTVLFRTQSEALIRAMTEFFRLWKRIEDTHLPAGTERQYALYDGKFVRSIAPPAKDCTADELAQAIGEYIQLFDRLMKGYVSGELDARAIEREWFTQMRRAAVLI